MAKAIKFQTEQVLRHLQHILQEQGTCPACKARLNAEIEALKSVRNKYPIIPNAKTD